MRKSMAALRSGRYLSEVLHVENHADRSGADRLEYWVDEEAVRRLESEVFDKCIVVTNRKEWSTEDILLANRG